MWFVYLFKKENMVFSPIRTANLRADVVAQIRQAIIEGQLKPGDHIIEKMITDQLGVSRTPVREALLLLESEGLIVSTPHRGSFVRTFNRADVHEIFTMRTSLENLAGELIIKRISDEEIADLGGLIRQQREAIDRGDFKDVRTIDMAFHRTLIDHAGHSLLKKSWEAIVAQIAALLYLRAEAFPNYDEYLAVQDHEAILSAYIARDHARVAAENRRINDRVANECIASLKS